MITDVGFEDFAFTQQLDQMPKLGGGTYQVSGDCATGAASCPTHNYGNLAPEYAMHGIVFKWAADSWVRGVHGEMTGSHPIVTEVAKNLQIEHNRFDGAWNKGKGGNGYLRGSRVWDSLYAFNTTRNLRHFTFQWSASNNVVIGNDFDSDLNLHGGWERRNLFENNAVRVPFEHRSGSCSANWWRRGRGERPGHLVADLLGRGQQGGQVVRIQRPAERLLPQHPGQADEGGRSVRGLQPLLALAQGLPVRIGCR